MREREGGRQREREREGEREIERKREIKRERGRERVRKTESHTHLITDVFHRLHIVRTSQKFLRIETKNSLHLQLNTCLLVCVNFDGNL